MIILYPNDPERYREDVGFFCIPDTINYEETDEEDPFVQILIDIMSRPI
jgi:hypothetical protein